MIFTFVIDNLHHVFICFLRCLAKRYDNLRPPPFVCPPSKDIASRVEHGILVPAIHAGPTQQACGSGMHVNPFSMKAVRSNKGMDSKTLLQLWREKIVLQQRLEGFFFIRKFENNDEVLFVA